MSAVGGLKTFQFGSPGRLFSIWMAFCEGDGDGDGDGEGDGEGEGEGDGDGEGDGEGEGDGDGDGDGNGVGDGEIAGTAAAVVSAICCAVYRSPGLLATVTDGRDPDDTAVSWSAP